MERSIRTVTRQTLIWTLSLTVAGCGASVAPGSVDQSTPPTADASSDPTARTTPSTAPGWVASGPLSAGLYYVDVAGVRFTFTIPDGWAGPDVPGFAVLKAGPTELAAMILSFWWPANIYADPCDATSLLDPPVGPTVGDLASAFARQSGTLATDPTPITVDGFDGQRLDIGVRTDVLACRDSIWLWLDEDGGRRSTDSDEDYELSILDVDGERVMIAVVYRPGTSAEERAELRTIFDSIKIDP